MGIFSKKTEASNTGIYVVNGKNLKPLNELPDNGSINGIAESLGYSTSQIHSVMTHNSDKTQCIVFKRGTQEPLFALVKDKAQLLSYNNLTKEIKLIDWKFENSLL